MRARRCQVCFVRSHKQEQRARSDGRCRGSPKPSGGDPDVTIVRQWFLRYRFGYRYRVVLDKLVADKHGR